MYNFFTSSYRIWDKLIGGSSQIIVFLGVSLLIHYRHSIFQGESNDEICRCISNVLLSHIFSNYYDYLSRKIHTYITCQVTKETSEIVVNEAIELWQEHGGPIGLTIIEPPKLK